MTSGKDNLSDLDRLLAGGLPAGAEREQLWQRIAGDVGAKPQLDTTPPISARISFWLRSHRLVLAAAAAPAAAAGLFLALQLVGQPELRSRGPHQAVPIVEATCGAVEAPCAVGDKIFLRVQGGEQPGFVAVEVVTQRGDLPLLSPRPVAAFEELPITVGIVVEPSDQNRPILIRYWFIPASEHKAESAPDVDSLKAHRQCLKNELRLKVVDP